MPKLRLETDYTYHLRTDAVPSKTAIISGSTSSAGILGYTHSMNATPVHAVLTVHGTSPYFATVSSRDSSGIEFKVFGTAPSGSALVSTVVTASVFLTTY